MKPIILIGYMGSGKSTIGRKLSQRLGLNFLDTDIYIENRFRRRIIDLFDDWGEDIFRKREHVITEEIVGIQDVVISTGGGLPCYHNNMDILLSEGITVYLYVNNPTLVKRLELCKRTRPTVANRSGQDLIDFVEESITLRAPIYQRAHFCVDVSNCENDSDEEDIVSDIVSVLKKKCLL